MDDGALLEFCRGLAADGEPLKVQLARQLNAPLRQARVAQVERLQQGARVLRVCSASSSDRLTGLRLRRRALRGRVRLADHGRDRGARAPLPRRLRRRRRVRRARIPPLLCGARSRPHARTPLSSRSPEMRRRGLRAVVPMEDLQVMGARPSHPRGAPFSGVVLSCQGAVTCAPTTHQVSRSSSRTSAASGRASTRPPRPPRPSARTPWSLLTTRRTGHSHHPSLSCVAPETLKKNFLSSELPPFPRRASTSGCSLACEKVRGGAAATIPQRTCAHARHEKPIRRPNCPPPAPPRAAFAAAGAAAGEPPRSVHVVAPSAWAWRGGGRRLAGLRGVVDETLCILPFEAPILVGERTSPADPHSGLDRALPRESASPLPRASASAAAGGAWCSALLWWRGAPCRIANRRRPAAPLAFPQEEAGLRATFIGHPVLDELEWDPLSRSWGAPRTAAAREGRAAALAAVSAAVGRPAGGSPGPVVCVLPGSRPQEVRRMLGLFGADPFFPPSSPEPIRPSTLNRPQDTRARNSSQTERSFPFSAPSAPRRGHAGPRRLDSGPLRLPRGRGRRADAAAAAAGGGRRGVPVAGARRCARRVRPRGQARAHARPSSWPSNARCILVSQEAEARSLTVVPAP